MKINFKKKDIAKKLCDKTGFSFNYSQKLINDLLECFFQQIAISDLNFKNFGIFKVSKKKQRIGRNPKTKEEFIITSRKSIRFVPSKYLKLFLNEI